MARKRERYNKRTAMESVPRRDGPRHVFVTNQDQREEWEGVGGGLTGNYEPTLLRLMLPGASPPAAGG